jgi:hypothetical protein
MKFLKAWSRRLIALGGIIMILIFVIDLNSRMLHMYQLRGQYEAELARVVELQAEERELDEQIAFARSEAIVDQWAREQNWMQQEGDFVIALMPGAGPPPEGMTESYEVVPEMDNWEAWRLWLTFRE